MVCCYTDWHERHFLCYFECFLTVYLLFIYCVKTVNFWNGKRKRRTRVYKFNWKKNPHTHMGLWCQRLCLSFCLSVPLLQCFFFCFFWHHFIFIFLFWLTKIGVLLLGWETNIGNLGCDPVKISAALRGQTTSTVVCASSENGEMGLFRPDLYSVFRLKWNF